jgi:hypothetical protein
MNPKITFVNGATGPPLTVTFLRSGAPVDLTNATVTAIVYRGGGSLPALTKTLVVLSPPTNGQAQLSWGSGDLVAEGGPIEYHIDFELTLQDTGGAVEIQPRSLVVEVRPSLV